MREYAKIGIRPTIDGRFGGVRESLEQQTMNMAILTKKLIEENVKYSDGKSVQCVISNTTIGCGVEANLCAEQFVKENVVATITVTPCWCYGSETMDLDPKTIKAVWGFNGTERPGAVYLAAVMSAYAQKGLPAFSIYGENVQDANDFTIPEDVKEKILKFSKSAIVVGSIKNKSYVNIGAVSMGIAGSEINSQFFQKYLGMRSEWVDMIEILRRINLGIYDKDEYEKALCWIKKNCKEGIDINEGKNLSEVIVNSKYINKDKDWEFIAKHALIVKDILNGNEKLNEIGWKEEALGKNAIAGGFQGQRMWTDWLPNGDFTEAILASSFDWNGKKEPTAFATENDTLNGVSMLFLTLLTNKAPIFSDVRTYWSKDSVYRVTGKQLKGKSENGIIHLINSGASALDGSAILLDENGKNTMKKWWDITNDDIDKCLKATDWCRANYEYFRGGGFSSHFKTSAEIPITMLRLNVVDGVGPTAQIIEGHTVVLDEDVHKILDERTDKTWPTTWFAPRTNEKSCKTVYDIMSKWGANHAAFVHGHIGEDLITLFSMLRIPVSLHNIDEEKIFRPHSFSSFGTESLEFADYSACKFYGALYK